MASALIYAVYRKKQYQCLSGKEKLDYIKVPIKGGHMLLRIVTSGKHFDDLMDTAHCRECETLCNCIPLARFI